MIKINKVLVIALVAMFVLGLAGINTVSAATTPNLGTTNSYGIISSIFTNSLNAGLETAIVGDVCYTTPPATAPISISGAEVTPCPPATGIDQGNALADLNSQAADPTCMNIGPAPALDAVDIDGAGPLPPGTFTPGCYISDTSMSITLGTTVTLDGAGTYIFKSGGDLTTGANSKVVAINGASACDIFWIPAGATTLGANASTSATPTFLGNIFRGDAAGLSITLGHFVNLEGRLLAFGSTVTTDSNTITVPICAAASATLNVIKHVINDNGGSAVAGDFTMDITGTNVSSSSFAGSEAGVAVTLDAGAYSVTESGPAGYLLSGSGDCSGTIAAGETKTCTITNNDIAPQLIVNKIVVNDNDGTKVIADFPLFIDGSSVTSGVAVTTSVGVHTVSETSQTGYTSTIGGDCAANGTITLALGDVKTCTITNDDFTPSSGGSGSIYEASVPPIIAVVKVPSPLALPAGPGSVTYTYTLRNIGTVPVSDVTMVGDTCSPIALISGDTNNDAKLDVNETWIYTCSTTLSETHTNIVTAIGWYNGISATDIANATVVVGVPVVPPLIHVTKVPSPLTLSASGGVVTYTNKVTNPGTVALSNVRLSDDKCDSVEYVSGDTNNDSKLDTTETWTYTCQERLTQTTTNTVTAAGDANGLTARDFATVTVVVAPVASVAPKLPNTGIASAENGMPWNIAILASALIIGLTSLIVATKKHTD